MEGEYGPEEPITEKLALYTIAHRNYLYSLDYQGITEYKINWGLRKIRKI